MPIKIVPILLALSRLVGIAPGYILRLLIALGQRGCLEIEIRQKLLEAREKASRILEEAEEQAEKMEETGKGPLREREERLEQFAVRLGKREEYLDERERTLADKLEQ